MLRLSGVTLARGGRVLVEGLDLTLAPGEAVHLTGPNGVGKTSLLRAIAGLLTPVAGRIDHRGVALADAALALDRELPLGRALEFWGGPNLSGAMTAMALDPLADVPVRMMSAGQAKRARLARVIASGAPLWLLDEPADALDAESVARLGAALATHRDGGGAVVAASHVPLPGQWRDLAMGV